MKNYEARLPTSCGQRPNKRIAPRFFDVLRPLNPRSGRRLTATPGSCLFLPECAERPNCPGRKLRFCPGIHMRSGRSAWLAVALLVFAVVGAAAAEPKRVLVLHSFGD